MDTTIHRTRMRKPARLLMAAGALLLLQGGAYGYFEGIRGGTRPEGMANAFTGVADDVNAIYYNPAGLALVDRIQIPSTYVKPLSGLDLGSIYQTYFAACGQVPAYEYLGTFGFAWLRRGADILLNLDDGSQDKGTLLDENALYLSWGRRMPKFRIPGLGTGWHSPHTTVGANLKILLLGWNPDLADPTGTDPWWDGDYSASGIGIDLAAMHFPPALPNLTLGFAATDLIKTSVGVHEKDYVESTFKLGGSYLLDGITVKERMLGSFRIPSFGINDLRLATDAVMSTRHLAYAYFNLGAEKWFTLYRQDFGFRTGWRLGARDAAKFALGLSYRYFLKEAYGGLPFKYGFQFDYAFTMPVGGIKSTYGSHMFTLTLLQGARIDRIPPEGEIMVKPGKISPDGDGKDDEATFLIVAKDDNGFREWQVNVLKESGEKDVPDSLRYRVVRTFGGTSKPPLELAWNGAEAGSRDPVENGTYYYELVLTDKGDNRIVTPKRELTVDVPPLQLDAVAQAEAFSPNGDSVSDAIGFVLTVDERLQVAGWGLVIEQVVTTRAGEGADMKVTHEYRQVRRFSGKERPAGMITWDGRDDNGKPAPHGNYRFQLVLRTAEGRTHRTRHRGLFLDLEGPRAELQVLPIVFSPDGDGKDDFTVLSVVLEDQSGVSGWQVDILRQVSADSLAPEPVRSWTGSAKDRRVFQWDGHDAAGNASPVGLYQCRLTATDNMKNVTVTPLKDLIIGEAQQSYQVFSPNGDGTADEVNIQVPSSKKTYDAVVMSIFDQQKRAVKSVGYFGGDFTETWDGTDNDGKQLPDDAYAYRFRFMKDEKTVDETPTRIIRIDTKPPEATLMAVPWTFSPAKGEKTAFSMLATDVSGIAGWQLVITDNDGKPYAAFNGKDAPPQNLAWDGKRADGSLDERGGRVLARLIVTDEVGNADTSDVRELVIFGEMKIIPIDPIHFETGKAVIKKESYPVLEDAAKILREAGDKPIAVHGHTDNIGGKEVNLKISRERAESVADYFVKFLKIPAERFVEVKGFGDAKPIAGNDTEQGRAVNRRTEIIILDEAPAAQPAPAPIPAPADTTPVPKAAPADTTSAPAPKAVPADTTGN